MIAAITRTGIFPGCGTGGCGARDGTVGEVIVVGVSGTSPDDAPESTGKMTVSGNPVCIRPVSGYRNRPGDPVHLLPVLPSSPDRAGSRVAGFTGIWSVYRGSVTLFQV